MNIFEGSRRIAKLLGVFIIFGFILAFLDTYPHSIAVIYQINETGETPTRVDKCEGEISEHTERSYESKGKVYVELCLPTNLATLDQLHRMLIKSDKDGKKQLAQATADEIRKRRAQLKDAINSSAIMNDPDYVNANEATKRAIRSKWGLDDNGSAIDYEAIAKKYGGVLSGEKSNKFDPDLFLKRRETVDSFNLPAADANHITRLKWLGTLKQAGKYFAGLVASLAAFWLFTWTVGWIARGFMGIHRGQDSKPNTPLESK
jgi:hypothetical protein